MRRNAKKRLRTRINRRYVMDTLDDNLPRKIQATYDRLLASGFISNAMPVWDDDKRAITNSIARSAVFAVVEKGTRVTLTEQRVPAPSNYEITVTGEQLDEADRDVYLQAVHYFRGRGPNEEVRVQPRDFLSAIGRKDGLESRKWLWRSITKMAKMLLEITFTRNDRKIKFVGSLLAIASEETNGVPGEIRMRLPLDILHLYNTDSTTLLSMTRRLSLKGPGSQLAKSLQAKIYSHKEPFPMKLETLMEQCGAKSKRIVDFKKSLILALNLLVENQDIESYAISKNGMVEIQRKARN